MAAKFGAAVVLVFAETTISLLPSLVIVVAVVVFPNALLGLAKAQAQFLFRPLAIGPVPGVAARPGPLPSSAEETHEDEEEEEVMTKPPNSPPHGTRPLIASPAARAAEVERRPSRCDSTRRSVQSPNPVEIRSKKSPEKLRLPHPTDLDLETFLPNDVVLLPLLFGLLSASSTTTTTACCCCCSALLAPGSAAAAGGG